MFFFFKNIFMIIIFIWLIYMKEMVFKWIMYVNFINKDIKKIILRNMKKIKGFLKIERFWDEVKKVKFF